MTENDFIQTMLAQKTAPGGYAGVTGRSLKDTDQVFASYMDRDLNWARVFIDALDLDTTLVPFSISFTPLWNEGEPRSTLAFMGVRDRRRIAADPDIDEVYLGVLASDPDRSVRRAVAGNPSTPPEIKRGLSADLSDGWGPFAQPGRDWDPTPDLFYLAMEYWVREKPGDLDKSIRLMGLAANDGHPKAIGQLLAMYRQAGKPEQGVAWLTQAAEAGNREAKSRLEELDSHAPKRAQSGGCYIATAVYGSYEAPEVVTLRRFRDEHLALLALGRAFIRTYYAISPPLAKHFAQAGTLNHLTKALLDTAVVRLEARTKRESDTP